MANLKLEAQSRTIDGRKVKQLRAQGLVPVVVYGKGVTPQSMQVDERKLNYVLHHGGASRLVEVDVTGGAKHNVLVRAVQRHPVNHRVLHADLYAVRMDEKQEVAVPVNSVGKPTSFAGGMMILQNRDTILVEALPADLPALIEVDITNLSLEHPITIADLPVIAGVTYLIDPHDHIFAMVAAQESAADAAEAASAEPEVLKKGKPDEAAE